MDKMRGFRGMAGVAARSEFQLHHLLPVSVFGHVHFSENFQLLKSEGFDPRYYSVNGLALPATERAASIWKMPMHRGPHRRYNELVSVRVASILSELENRRCSQQARVEAIGRLNLLICTLRHILIGDRPFILLNSRDPLNSNAQFWDIEAACDKLWVATK
jgi:A nuclease family of the HNH/ENDO VII superfamily with conserved AHH